MLGLATCDVRPGPRVAQQNVGAPSALAAQALTLALALGPCPGPCCGPDPGPGPGPGPCLVLALALVLLLALALDLALAVALAVAPVISLELSVAKVMLDVAHMAIWHGEHVGKFRHFETPTQIFTETV